MKKVKIFTLILVFVSVNLYIGVYSFHSYGKFLLINTQLNIKKTFDTQPHFLRTIDIDKDNEDEIVFSYPWEDLQQISIFELFKSDYNSHHYGEIAVPSTYSFWGADYDSERKIYVFRFIEFADGQLILRDVDNQMNPRGKPLPVNTGSLELAKYNNAFLKPILVDLEADGKKELVVLLLPGSIPSPGTLACIEPETGKLLWYYQTGTGIIDMEFKDLDRNGKKEIILSTYAANRGVELNGTRDRFSYVILLNCKGKLRWKERVDIQNTFSHSIAADLDDDGFYEIVTASQGTNLRTLKCKLSVFDSHGQHKVPYFLLTNSYFTRPIVLKYRNGYRIYVGDSNGTLRIFDQHLTLLVEKKIKDNIPVYVLNPSTSPGKWNEVFVYSRGQLMAYDMELKNRLFTFNVEPPYSANTFVPAPLLLPLNSKAGNHVLVNSDNLYLISKSEPSPVKNMADSRLLFCIIAFILFNSLFIYFIPRYSKILGFRPHHLETEADISSTIKALQAIAHKIKGAIGTAGCTIEKINRSAARGNEDKKSKTDYSQLAGLLIEDAETLRQQTDNILKLVQIQKPKLHKKGLKHLLQKLVNHYRSVLDDKIEITFQMEKDIALNYDKELFKEAMINLLDNAIDAMPEGGKLRVSVVPVASPARRTTEQVLIEVEDTGRGIDEADIPQLFTPFFTKKENKKGTGIGLTICKRIIAAHGGTIAVHSRKGFGTKFAITIPVQ